jgi:hypothetical protein
MIGELSLFGCLRFNIHRGSDKRHKMETMLCILPHIFKGRQLFTTENGHKKKQLLSHAIMET